MTLTNGRGRWAMVGVAALVVAAGLLALGVALAARAEAGWVWLGTPLADQVAAQLAPTDPASTDANFLSAAYQPRKQVHSWHLISAEAENGAPLWQSVLDDDPNYALAVTVEVEYSNGQRARLRWSTWHYGLVLGPLVVDYGARPAGELTRLADTLTP
jgi:hypothetical protein